MLLIPLTIQSLIFYYVAVPVEGINRDNFIPCSETIDCTKYLNRTGSVCVNRKFCSNPFIGGCLDNLKLNKHPSRDLFPNRPRACNSHDFSNGDYISTTCKTDTTLTDKQTGDIICRKSSFDYQEIRILNQDWESPMFMGWIMQILLSEVLDVPVSIESGTSEIGKGNNLYDLNMEFNYPTKSKHSNHYDHYDYRPLEVANEYDGDCLKVMEINEKNDEDDYKSCAHILPEAWSGEKQHWVDLEDKGVIEHVDSNGSVGKFSWMIPKFLARSDPTLMSYHGIFGIKNRRKLAKIFKSPTNWRDYCNIVSKTNCKHSDEVTRRPPISDEEGDSYFIRGNYTGFFRSTEKNNCTTYPPVCKGHIVIPPCDYGTFVSSQIYWNDVHVESAGPITPTDSYSHDHVIQIWHAANATKSPVLMVWHRPDAIIQEYVNTDFEFQNIFLPPPSKNCVDNRPTTEERCEINSTARYGEKISSCDNEAHPLHRFMVKSLLIHATETPIATRSPAHDFIRALGISDLDMSDIFDHWISRQLSGDRQELNSHQYRDNHFDPRMAVCEWVGNNYEHLKAFVPPGYPRIKDVVHEYEQWYIILAIVYSLLAIFLVLCAAIITNRYTDTKAVKYAQIDFLYMILSGFLLISFAALLYVMEPSPFVCVAKEWALILGYTMELVPLLVKVAGINKMAQASRKMRRYKLKRHTLYELVIGLVFITLIYLISWTAIDRPKVKEMFILDNEYNVGDTNFIGFDNETEEYPVKDEFICASESRYWVIISTAWQVALLLVASVLAFQTRNVRQEFNESLFLMLMIYAHLLLLIFRATSSALPSSIFSPYQKSGLVSVFLSTDAILTLSVYFGPKFYAVYLETKGQLVMIDSSKCSSEEGINESMRNFRQSTSSYWDKRVRSLATSEPASTAPDSSITGNASTVTGSSNDNRLNKRHNSIVECVVENSQLPSIIEEIHSNNENSCEHKSCIEEEMHSQKNSF